MPGWPGPSTSSPLTCASCSRSREWSEPFASRQVGLSAMPFKRNPIYAENVDSLARWMAALPRVAWENTGPTLSMERTLG